MKHLVSDYDFEFIDYLRNYSNATNMIEKEIRKINTLDNDQMWKTKVINNAAFITTSLAFRRRELDNNQKVLSKKKYLTYLISSRGSPYVDVVCKETVPPPPPDNIDFYLSIKTPLI